MTNFLTIVVLLIKEETSKYRYNCDGRYTQQ
jgi:hypothetical protein